MNSNTKIKKKIIVILCACLFILIGLLWPYVEYISVVTLGTINAKMSSNINKKKLMEYLEKTYNEDFEIIDYVGGTWDLWSGRQDDSLIVKRKEYGNYLFEIRAYSNHGHIIDKRNEYHYGYILKKNIINRIISKYPSIETITDATISGEGVDASHLSTEENETNKILDTLYLDDANSIVYKIIISNSTASDKNQLVNMMYSIYQYLWETRCNVYFSIKIIDDELFENTKVNLAKRLDPLEIGNIEESIYMDYSMSLSSNRYFFRNIKEDPQHYLSKEEFTELMNREWISPSLPNN